LFANIGVAEIEDKKIIFGHYPTTLKTAMEKAKTKYDLALHGHTHQPWEEYWQETKILNPGNIANIRYAPTFAIVNLNNLEAKLILLNEI
jgi:predicted phosphodiesterase